MKIPFQKKSVQLTIIIILGLSLLSCSSGHQKSSASADGKSIQNENSTDIPFDGTNFKIPSPMELFIFMEKRGTPFVKEALSNPAKHVEFVSQKSKALNLGVYCADLAYCSVNGNIQETIVYFNTAKLLATEMGLHEGFGEQIALRIDNNLNNTDSLKEIASDSFNDANQFLEEQGLADIQGLIITGGWLESLYLALKSANGNNLSDPLIEMIADQQVLLENLLQYLSKYSESSNVFEVITKLDELQEIYDQLYYNDEKTRITKEQFVDINNKVVELRDSMILN